MKGIPKMDNIWILAVGAEEADNETATTTSTNVPSDPNTPPGNAKSSKPFDPMFMVTMGLMFVVFYFLLFRGPQKKQQKHKKMVQSLQKNDRILTVGGIYGTVVDIKDNEITIKIDESNNTKMRISRNAIADNMSKEKDL
jgi:preprotein translocase subunit YajC